MRAWLRALVVVGVIVGGVLALATYQTLATTWVGPHLNLDDVGESGSFGRTSCWEVISILERELVRKYDQTVVLEVRPLFWSEIEVFQMPDFKPVPHDQSGTVDLGDVACTTNQSQLWIYIPTQRELARHCYVPEWTNCQETGLYGDEWTSPKGPN